MKLPSALEGLEHNTYIPVSQHNATGSFDTVTTGSSDIWPTLLRFQLGAVIFHWWLMQCPKTCLIIFVGVSFKCWKLYAQ